MNTIKKLLTLSGFMSFIALSSIQCGGGGSGGTTLDTDVDGLTIAQQMSLLEAQDESGNGNLTLLNADEVPTSGDYVTDETEYYTYDQSMEALNTVNDILCMLDQTKYSEMVNQGAYIALVDADSCERNADHSSDSDDQSSGQAQEFEKWIIESTRESNDSDQIVKGWVELGEEDDGDQFSESEIRFKMTITEGKSETNPYGLFSMDFQSFDSEGSVLMTGNLSSVENEDGMVEFLFKMDMGDVMSEKVHAVLDPNEDAGHVYVSRMMDFSNFELSSGNLTFLEEAGISAASSEDGESFSQTILGAFDTTHYLFEMTTEGEDEDIKCRDRQNFRTNAWEYNLYSADGERKALNGGMSIRYDLEDEEVWGWAGYYGIWFPEDLVTVENGLVVTDGDGANEYTLLVADGRLIQKTKGEITLGELTDDLMYMWDWEEGENYTVKWNGSSLVRVSKEECDEDGCSREALDEEEEIETEPFEWYGFWKEGFGSINLVVPESGTLSDATTLTYFAEVYVAPGLDTFDGEVTLQCYFSCPKGPITADDMNLGSAFLSDSFSFEEDAEPFLYSFDPVNYELTYEGEAVAIEDPENVDEFGAYSWGVRSGSMVTDDVILNSPWSIWDSDTSYEWETGPHSWNKYMALMDSNGEAIEFDAPMTCTYDSEELGTFILHYEGPGKLWGIPWEKVEDEETDFEHWAPEFSLDNGTELDCDGTTYFVKQVSAEQLLLDVDEDACSDLAIDETVGEPDNEYTDPNIGTAPEVTDAPAVIAGELQE